MAKIVNGLTATKIKDVWKIIFIRPIQAGRMRRIMRIHDLASNSPVPEEVLTERIYGSGIFRDANKDRFILQGEQLIQLNAR